MEVLETKLFGIGSEEHAIKELQTLLKKLGYDCGPVDGVLGEKTKAAVKDFQSDNCLVPTGDLDENTFDMIAIKGACVNCG